MTISQEQVGTILNYVSRYGVSDIHLSANNFVKLRINGVLESVGDGIVSSDDIKEIVRLTMSEKQQQEFAGKFEYDYAFRFQNICRFRANAFFNVNGNCLVLRKIPNEVPDLSTIGAPPILNEFIKLSQGLILITGATGTGKSTTLAAMIDNINQNQKKHIITIEDPVEFLYSSKQCLINQRELHRSTNSFADALRAALREDPDIILVGEMRDRETVELALEAAETGHLVFSTLHTNNAYDSVNRIVDMFPPDAKTLATSLLSSALEGVVSQRLVQKIDGAGRYPLHEILVATNAVKNLIREGNVPQIASMMQVGARHGMQTMVDCAAKAVRNGFIAPEVLEALQPKKE